MIDLMRKAVTGECTILEIAVLGVLAL